MLPINRSKSMATLTLSITKNSIPAEVINDLSNLVSNNPEIAQQAVSTYFPKFTASDVAPLGTKIYVVPAHGRKKDSTEM